MNCVNALTGAKIRPVYTVQLSASSLDIRYTWYDKESVLPCEIISYPQTSDCTRSTEYRKMMFDSSRARGSVIATEYPLNYDPAAEKGNIPYYPVVTEESRARYQMYLREVSEYENLFLCGRLAEFRYYNMDICIEHALQYFENIGSTPILVDRVRTMG